MEETQKILKENFEALPQDVQNVITSQETANKINSLVFKYELTHEQKSALKNEIFLILFGVEKLSKLETNIANKVGIDKNKTPKIIDEINRDLFNPVVESLKEIEEIIDEVDSKEKDSVQIKIETPPTPPDHLLQSHEMIKEPHLHSQTVMPEMEKDNKSAPKNSFFSRMHNNPSVKPEVIRVISEEQIPVPKPPPKITPEPEKKLETFVAKAQEFAPITPPPVIKPAAQTQPQPNQQTAPQNKFSSIVDQKLSRLVRTERDNTQIKNEVEKSRQEKYGGNDPYREPIK